MSLVDVLARSVHDDEKLIAQICDHEIVEDSPCIIGQNRLALPANRERHNIDRHYAFERQDDIFHASRTRSDGELTHVRHIE
jgi:hypothetical protein